MLALICKNSGIERNTPGQEPERELAAAPESMTAWQNLRFNGYGAHSCLSACTADRAGSM
jgi:hypothetical protein